MKEDDLKKTRGYLNLSSALLALAIMVIAGLSKELVSWFFQLAATLIAATLAGSIGLYLYSRQLTERRQHFHTLLDMYLDYLMENTPTEPTVGRINMSFVNQYLRQF